MITNNSFNGGLNQDIAKTKYQNNQYLDATNIRLLTDNGLSSATLSNVRGNNLDITIPDTQNVYKISVNFTGPYVAGTFTILAQTSSTNFTPSSTTTGQDIYNFISQDPNHFLIFSGYNIAIGTNYVVIYSTSNNTSPSFSGSGLTVSTLVSSETKLIPIGFTTLRDDIYLFTTPNTSKNPGGHDPDLSVDASSTGQIFKITYDAVNYSSDIDLIYNGYLDFTTYRPIPRTASLGRYENTSTQRLYWTDFYNPLRAINVKDPNVMALDPSVINIAPTVNFSMPILDKILLGGSLKVGSYQLAYRLKNTGGSLTNYSELSNMVFIVPNDENINTGGANFKDYYGANQGTITSKSIRWRLQDLDTDFDRIELVIVRKETLTGSIDIFQFSDEPIPSNGEILVTFSGTEDLIQIDLNDFNAISSAFTHCKTIVTKDNILFAGNTKNVFSDINYDARVYRFPVSSLTFDITEGVATNTYDSTTWNTIDELSDAINANTTTQRYKENSTILGGSGPNISFEFGTIAIRADSTINPSTTASGPDFRHTNPEYNISLFELDVKRINGVDEQVYPTNGINDDIKYAYYSGLFKGWERNETYRLGLTFHDKQKNPLFTKWINDIQIPDHLDECESNNAIFEDGSVVPLGAYTGSAIKDFRMSFIHNKTGTVEAFVNQIYIKFDIKIPDSITNIIGGYTISRVKREITDKTVLGTGILTQVVSDGGSLWLPDTQPSENGCPALTTAYPFLNIDLNTRANPGEASDTTPLFDCPEFLLGGFPGWKSGDKLRIINRIDLTNTNTAITIDGGAEPYNMYKYYDIDDLYSDEFTIEEAGEVGFAGSFAFTGTTNNSWNFSNMTRTTTNTSDALGSKTLAIGLTNTIQFNSTYSCTEANGKKLIAQYIRPISNQYGGNTYTDRSTNEYIPCSHFRPVTSYITNLTYTTDTFKAFGGDIFTQVYDNQKEVKNWGQSSRGIYSSGGGCTPGANVSKVSLTYFFPCTASHNTDLRHGSHVNRNLDSDDGSGASGNESQEYNLVYSAENDIRKYFPKPSEFVLQEEFDNRIYYSGVKINGELVDSWGLFKPNNYYDVEGIYGPINAMDNLNQSILFWQDRAFGSMLINPTSTTTDDSGTSIVLGNGLVMQKHNYASTTVGTKHQHSVIKSNRGIYWIDVNNKRVYRISSDGVNTISEIKGMSSFFNKYIRGEVINNDNPIYYGTDYRAGILGAFDSRYNEVLFTIHDYYTYILDGEETVVRRAMTISYNEILDGFSSFYTFTPYFYMWDTRFMSTTNLDDYNNSTPPATQKLWLHDRNALYGNFYNRYYDSYIKYLVNTSPSQHKVFDNIHLQTEVQTIVNQEATDTGSGSTPVHETINKIRVFNDYQDSGIINLVPNTNIKRRHRYWKLDVPRDTTPAAYTSLKPRMRDYYLITELFFTNNNDKRLILHDVLTEFRLKGSPISNQ